MEMLAVNNSLLCIHEHLEFYVPDPFLFQHLLAGDVAGGVRRLLEETKAMTDQAPQATLNGVANCRRMLE